MIDSASKLFFAWLRLLRPRQVLKNGFVILPLIFSGEFRHLPSILLALAGFAAFALASMGIYCWNDALDVEADRRHPKKRFRPVASGDISRRSAFLAGLLLIFGSLGLSLAINVWMLGVLAGYVVLQIAYCLRWKHVPLLDVMAIASGFLLRVVAGAMAIGVVPSSWLLICTTFLALLLALVKRRQEVVLLSQSTVSEGTRRVLAHYPLPLLDQLIAGLVPTTLLSYMLYAYHVQPPAFLATSAFVAYGLFRYLYLMHTREAGEQPEDVLLKDPATLLNVVAWAIVSGGCLLLLSPKLH